MALMHICNYAGCHVAVPVGTKYCPSHAAKGAALDERKRKERMARLEAERVERSGNSTQRGYDSRWRKARDGYLRLHPLCVRCQEMGLLVPAEVVDHIVPHKGDKALFWDSANWQPLCKRCHDKKTFHEDGGFGLPCPKQG